MIAFFTIYELEQLTDDQLDELFAALERLLMATATGTPERRNILASLENITRVRNDRRAVPAPSL
ncbi:hypothetical protein [Rhodovulum visakhapatnamense]|uniref:Uncharacterized protein n=1 Tax=Rhodovulum visakhapatnamense TaxID=364297 RepID=A0A4R8FGK9_9RHOB|nr:hypothetical protein [Rhodovulum visakhapatnamense]TDX21251.1 hypothetical protein EV657_14310 [Rhodovulum visakhapatnamense]